MTRLARGVKCGGFGASGSASVGGRVVFREQFGDDAGQQQRAAHERANHRTTREKTRSFHKGQPSQIGINTFTRLQLREVIVTDEAALRNSVPHDGPLSGRLTPAPRPGRHESTRCRAWRGRAKRGRVCRRHCPRSVRREWPRTDPCAWPPVAGEVDPKNWTTGLDTKTTGGEPATKGRGPGGQGCLGSGSTRRSSLRRWRWRP